ncbi:hypothetical protein BCR33DRAFT_711123 [Rhizoclosmatium globosum]|uniref:Uncharacterized protein n=1 Tax=Rhizoclosmatium globosum TaxID=329046 RepID=A0A1Y2D391_9FUNG|nr:hypothetical protein BCR33DRAFT_711123 [Rhizoclosmatium globosum]|eukprot:ORY53761.1 hypothetical protein BCR33DRAFT_711123 [Rhizoclosmatium globosum]
MVGAAEMDLGSRGCLTCISQSAAPAVLCRLSYSDTRNHSEKCWIAVKGGVKLVVAGHETTKWELSANNHTSSIPPTRY